MAASQTAQMPSTTLLRHLYEARVRTDGLFRLLPPNSLYERPIPERHRLIFYLGHLEAFDWNLLSSVLGLESHNPAFDKLFAFGIDPVDSGLPTDKPSDWPSIGEIGRYNQLVRDRLDERLRNPKVADFSNPHFAQGTLLHAATEHRLMHAETLAYLLHNLAFENKKAPSRPAPDPSPAPRQRQIRIPAGVATLGQPRNPESFGWDNEFEEVKFFVPSFSVDAFPVTNAAFLGFVRAGGYDEPSYWTPEDWKWQRTKGIEHPHFWVRRSDSMSRNAEWDYRTMFGLIPLPLSWPVYVSHAEAAAYARWTGKKLPSEAQWHRAAYGTPDETERLYPWGESNPDRMRGNFDFNRWDAMPVDAHPAGAGAFGVFDLLGNGWEWTSTIFGSLPGFTPFPFYLGYSSDFFDGKHYVTKGGSPQTAASMLRRSFRNWFQPHYPYIYTTFRCMEE